jgi:hypothetical protein
VRACTAIMGNFLPHARVLARSYQEHHRGERMVVLVIDDDGGDDEPFDVVRPWQLGLEEHEVHRVLTLCDGALPAGAFRAALMLHVLRTTQESVLFLDPDVRVYAPLDELADLALRFGVVLSPNLLNAPDRHLGFVGDHRYLLAGAFNSGLVATSARSVEFLDWWASRLQRWTLLAAQDGYYGAQRWLDLVPAMFEHHVLRAPGYNVMALNAHERGVGLRGERWYTREGPLRMFHFGGRFDPELPHLLAPGYAPPEVLLSEHAALAELHRHYAEELLASGWSTRPPLPPPIELEPGLSLDSTMRAMYRDALITSEATGTPEPPTPYGSGRARFVAWLREPGDQRRNARVLSRYLLRRWRDEGRAAAFPDLPGDDGLRFLTWARGREGVEAGIPARMSESTADPVETIDVTSESVNLVASDDGPAAVLGARIAEQLRVNGERVVEIAYPRDQSARALVSSSLAEAATGDVNFICLPAGLVPAFDYDLGILFRPGRRTILAVTDSLWSADSVVTAAALADEIWCWEERTAEQIRSLCDARVEVLSTPRGRVPREPGGDELVCWGDLGERGHADALLARVRRHLDAGPTDPAARLHVYLSSWDADRATYETLIALSRSDDRLAVSHAASWSDALQSARVLLALGGGGGPVEADARSVGIKVVLPDGTIGIAEAAPAPFASEASARLRGLRAPTRNLS